MSKSEIAKHAVQYWSGADAITAVAIAGAESHWESSALGDPLSAYSEARQEEWLPYSWAGYTSIGPYQIHMPSHHDKLEAATGSEKVGDWAVYLGDPAQNTYIAWLVWKRSGWWAWTTYTKGTYLRFWSEAAKAIEELVPGPTPPPPLPPDILPERAIPPPWAAVEPPYVATTPPGG